MNTYAFGFTRTKTTQREDRRRQKVAKKHGADWVPVQLPEGWRGWFVCPNRGAPFDGQTSRDVLDELGIDH